MDPELDADGWLVMDAFPDTRPPDEDGDREPEVYVDPPPLPDSDWLAAISTAVALPQDSDGQLAGEPEDPAVGPWNDYEQDFQDERSWLINGDEDPVADPAPQSEPADHEGDVI